MQDLVARPLVKKKVCLVVNRDRFFLSHRLPLAIKLKQSGFDVTVIAEDTGSGARIEEAGLSFISLPISRASMHPLRELQTLLFLIQVYRRLKPDIVHHITPKAIFYGTLAASINHIPHRIQAIVGLGSSLDSHPNRFNLKQWIIRKFYRASMRGPGTRSIFMNATDLDDFRRLGILDSRHHAMIISGSGVDTEKFKPRTSPRKEIAVMFASRLLKDKGLCEFIEASRILKQKYPHVRFVIVGEPDVGNPTSLSLRELKSILEQVEVEWWGHSEEMEKTLQLADIFVLPSYREGLPKVLLEAAAVGLPIVATRVPGCEDCVVHQNTGLLVSPRDPQGLADSIEILIQSPELRKEMGQNARELVEKKFSAERIVGEQMLLYKSLESAPLR